MALTSFSTPPSYRTAAVLPTPPLSASATLVSSDATHLHAVRAMFARSFVWIARPGPVNGACPGWMRDPYEVIPDERLMNDPSGLPHACGWGAGSRTSLRGVERGIFIMDFAGVCEPSWGACTEAALKTLVLAKGSRVFSNARLPIWVMDVGVLAHGALEARDGDFSAFIKEIHN